MRTPPRGLYVLTDHDEHGIDRLLEDVSAAIAGGAAMVQYRDKSADAGKRLEQAAALASLCRRHDVRLLINDDPALASQVGADGVHLGRDDAGLDEARALLGPDAIIGLSCYNEWPRAERAARSGADYLAFGSVFPSSTKPAAVHAPLALLSRARRELKLPICAIGGITPDRTPELIAAGADLIAVISGIFGQPDPQAAARAYALAFDGG
jgi:thiamine-phosphate pyrophosphorylase